jgi:hypothetical protein
MMPRKVIRALMLFVAISASWPSTGATADVRVSHLHDKGRFADINLRGEITRADVEQFRKFATFLGQHFETVTANLDSSGGDLLAAIEIGSIVRDNWIWTAVEDNTECSSASLSLLLARSA